jgi:hypothetical protein
MKSGYTFYTAKGSKLEIILDDVDTVEIYLGDEDNWEQAYGIEITYSDFREFMKDVAGQLFDLSGER